jgi:hypothetical protein
VDLAFARVWGSRGAAESCHGDPGTPSALAVVKLRDALRSGLGAR